MLAANKTCKIFLKSAIWGLWGCSFIQGTISQATSPDSLSPERGASVLKWCLSDSFLEDEDADKGKEGEEAELAKIFGDMTIPPMGISGDFDRDGKTLPLFETAADPLRPKYPTSLGHWVDTCPVPLGARAFDVGSRAKVDILAASYHGPIHGHHPPIRFRSPVKKEGKNTREDLINIAEFLGHINPSCLSTRELRHYVRIKMNARAILEKF
jgi:hypothetical protein